MRGSILSLLWALFAWLNFRPVEAVDALKRTHLGNFNYSYFTGALFTSAAGICFDNPDYQTLGFIDTITDATDALVTRPLGALSFYTSKIIFNQSVIFLDLSYKAVTQKIKLDSNDLITITVSESAVDQSHMINVDISGAPCAKMSTLPNTNDNSSISSNLSCATPYGNFNLSYKLIQTVNRTIGYSCNFQTVKIAPIKTSPIVGYRIDWNATWEVDSNHKAKILSAVPSVLPPTQTTLDYSTVIQDIVHVVSFESKEPVVGKQLRLSVGLMNFQQTVVERGCVQKTGDRCTQCQDSYTLVSGECVCNRNGAIATFPSYTVALPDATATVTSASFYRAGCRMLGATVSPTQGICEQNLDFILKHNFTVNLTKSAANMGDIIISLENSNNTFSSAVSSCTDYNPSFTLAFVINGKPKGIGRYGLSHPVVSNQKISTSTGPSYITVSLTTLTDYLNYFCRSIPLSDIATAYDCLLRGQLGPSPTLVSMEYNYRLGIVRSSSAATGTKMDIFLLDLNSTKFFFGALSQTDSNMTTRILTYNTSDTSIMGLDYNKRFIWTDQAAVEKSQVLRMTFEMNNMTMLTRYSMSDVKISAIRTDEPESPYVGHTCNSTITNLDFFQSAVIDCTFSLKDNVTFMVNWTLARRSGNTFPDQLLSNHTLMFEVYQQNQLIQLAGLSYGVTIGVVIFVLLAMTSSICFLAYKAGAVENLQELKEGLSKGLKDHMENINDMFKKDKGGKGVKEKLVDNKDKPKKKKKKARDEDHEDDEDDVEDELSKVNVSEIKPRREHGDDSILKGTKAKGNILAMLDGDKKKKDRGSDDEEDLEDEELKPKKPTKRVSEKASIVGGKKGKDSSKEKIAKGKKTSEDEEHFSEEEGGQEEVKRPAGKTKK
jgi:hypothetical protein